MYTNLNVLHNIQWLDDLTANYYVIRSYASWCNNSIIMNNLAQTLRIFANWIALLFEADS